jgi:hypothetical protein
VLNNSRQKTLYVSNQNVGFDRPAPTPSPTPHLTQFSRLTEQFRKMQGLAIQLVWTISEFGIITDLPFSSTSERQVFHFQPGSQSLSNQYNKRHEQEVTRSSIRL